MSSTKTFETLPPLKLFFIVAIPGAISTLASSLYTVIDLALVGRFIGQLGFAAVTLVMPLVVINFSLADLIGVGSSVPISICLGKKQEGEANNIFTCSCLIILVIGAITGIIIYFASPFIVSIMGATGALADMAVQYVRVFAICSPVMTIMFAMDNYLRICNKIRFSTG